MGLILHSYLVIGGLFIVGLLVSAVLHALLCLLSGMLGSTRRFGYRGVAGECPLVLVGNAGQHKWVWLLWGCRSTEERMELPVRR